MAEVIALVSIMADPYLGKSGTESGVGESPNFSFLSSGFV